MPESEAVQSLHAIIGAFQRATIQRINVETSQEARRNAERWAADAELQHACQHAETLLESAKADATTRLNDRRAAADAALREARREPDDLLNDTRKTFEDVQQFLIKQDRKELLESVKPKPVIRTRKSQPMIELRNCASAARVYFDKLQKLMSSSGCMLRPLFLGICMAIFFAAFYLIAFPSENFANLIPTVLCSMLFIVVTSPVLIFYYRHRKKRSTLAALWTKLVQCISDARYWHSCWVDMIEQQRQEQLTAAESEYQQALSLATSEHKKRLDLANEQYQRRITTIDSHHRQALLDARDSYEKAISHIFQNAKTLTQSVDPVNAVWDDPRWATWAPMTEPAQPQHVRIGQVVSGRWQRLTLPALLPFPADRALLFQVPETGKHIAIEAVQSLALRLLAAFPPGKVRFTFIDPIGLGQSVAPFMHLGDYDERLVTGKVWTEPHQIEQRLADLTEHMENVIQKYLRNQYATIEEYNAQAGEVAEAYRLVVALDFPANFTETAARRLVSIAQNGPRCGVYAIILANASKPLPYGFSMHDLEQAAIPIQWNQQHFVWNEADFCECVLELDAPPGAALFDHILKTVGAAAKEASKVEVPFARIAPAPEQWWTADSSEVLSAPLGPAGARKVQQLRLGVGTAQHVLVAGKTGSGKSTLLHTLITALALAYSPQEVELYLIDFKKGVEFKTYAAHALPHARVIAIESEREFGLSVLQGLDAELKRRGDLFRAAGVDGLADYRRRSGARLPRLLLLVDEFQEFFTEDDPVATQAAQLLDRLVRQGRAFGIHILLGSQTLAGAYSLARSTIDQMAVRIALQCSEADSRLILSDDNPAARLLSRPGEAIYNAANGMIEGNNRFQVAWLSDEQRDQYLQEVQALARQREYRRPQPQLVFEGNAPVKVEQNDALLRTLVNPTPAAPGRALWTWLGEPIAIRDPVTARFQRQSGSNLLIVGQSEEAALAMMVIALISLAAQHPRPTGAERFFVLDFSAREAPHADLLTQLAQRMPGPIVVGRRRQLPAILDQVATEVRQRADDASADAAPLFLFVYGLQRARDLRQEEGFGYAYSYGAEPAPPSPAQQFAVIVRDGPDVGVHTIVWCDTATNLHRSLDRRSVREFAQRVAFQMSGEDSAALLDTPAASRLGPHRALFAAEEEGRVEKFRPYALPSTEWLARVTELLQAKTVNEC